MDKKQMKVKDELDDAKPLRSKGKDEGFKKKGKHYSKQPSPMLRSERTNDFSWMNKYPELMKDAANLIQNYIPGTTRSIGKLSVLRNFIQCAGISVPILVTPGRAADATDPFNMQMKALWLDLHRKYRGIGTYESSDLGIIIFCIMNVFAFISEGERAYGVAAQYSAKNRHIPNAYTNLLNWDFTSLRADLANFRYQLNRLITKASALCLPKGYAAFNDVVTLFGSIFKDRPEDRSQLYVATQGYTWEYNATGISTGSAAKAVRVLTTWTSSSYLLRLEAMIDALIQDDDVARVCSDILAAYGENGVATLFHLPEEYVVQPVYDEIRSLQFHNLVTSSVNVDDSDGIGATGVYTARSTGITGYSTDVELVQLNNVIQFRLSGGTYLTTQVYKPPVTGAVWEYATQNFGATTPAVGELSSDVIDVWKTDATPEVIAEATRLMVTVNRQEVLPAGTPHFGINYITHGLYVPTHIIVVMMADSGSYVQQKIASNYEALSDLTDDDLESIFQLGHCDNAPMISVNESAVFGNAVLISGDKENIIFTNPIDLNALFAVINLSEWKLDHLDIIKER